MLIGVLSECIAEMKSVHEMETVSADTKKQAEQNYSFRQTVLQLKTLIEEIDFSNKNTGFCPSYGVNVILKSLVVSCDKIINEGCANSSTTDYILNELNKVKGIIEQEWGAFYYSKTHHLIGMVDTIKNIIDDEAKAKYAINKIKKAEIWNPTPDTFEYLHAGVSDAEYLIGTVGIDENSDIMKFLKQVGAGEATVLDLSGDILEWIKTNNIGDKLFIRFS